MESETEKKEIIAKLQQIFEKTLFKDFTTTNYAYFERLLAYLAEKERTSILQEPFMINVVDKAIDLMSADITMNSRIVPFFLNVCALLISKESLVDEIKDRKLITRVFSFIESQKEHISPSMKLSLIRVISAISKYPFGLSYVRESKIWRFLIEYCNQDHTIYVIREARKLLFELLYKYAVIAKDEKFVIEILREIIEPILENVYDASTETITIVVEDTVQQHKLASTLELLSFIFQQTLESEEKMQIFFHCRDHFNLEINIWKLCELTTNQPFLQKILTTLVSFNFCRIVDEMWTGHGEISPEKFTHFGIGFFNFMKFCLARRDLINFLNLTELFHVLWKKLGTRAPKEILVENESIQFENQVIVLHLMPLIFLFKSKEFKEAELFDTFLMKMFQISCEHTEQICYSYRDILFDSKEIVPSLACKSINGILSMENILDHDQALVVFQTITYALQEFILNSNEMSAEGNESNTPCVLLSSELISEIPNVFYAALVGLQRLIKRFRITWIESLESINLLNFVLNLLKNCHMTSRLIVQGLQLLQLSIENYLMPNMVDTLNDSSLMCIASVVAKRFHDPAWEVRDSTLELTASIANISIHQFPPFQKYLIENKIAPIVYEMAKHDIEPYVRASAFKCLSKMVATTVIWENELRNLDLIEHLFSVLLNESEGIVRREALVTLSKVYEHRTIPCQYNDTLYSILSHCVVNDLHWEVKIVALNFWELEIEAQFSNQGMIDGCFPTVTFSEEYRKTVTLTEMEINLRISKILNSLSQCGCLGVLLKCLHEDCDLAVVKTAVEIIRRLLQMLQKYDYELSLSAKKTINDDENILASNNNFDDHNQNSNDMVKCEEINQGEQGEIASDDVIERILNDQDINYLIDAYERQMKFDPDMKTEQQHVDSMFYRQFTNVTANDFVTTTTNIDMEQLLQKQENFLCAENLVSLLDEILTEIAPNDNRIYADCY